MKLSIVICVYNEEENIAPLINLIFEAITDIEFEIIYVDDGSTDNTAKNIMEFNDKRIKLVQLRKNYGQSSALDAGIEEARGEYIVTMDGDLQNDPSDIPLMLKKAEEGEWDLVAGERINRQDGMVMRKMPSRLANFIIRLTTKVRIRDYGCTLKLFKSDIAKNIRLYGELHRFIPVLAYLEGASITQVPVKHHPRRFGKSKYGISRTFRVVSDLMLMIFFKRYLQKPMHLFGTIGIVVFIAGSVIELYMLVLKILGQDVWGKPLLLLGILFIVGGIQFITIGIMAELLMRTYYESQKKKPYSVKRVVTGEK